MAASATAKADPQQKAIGCVYHVNEGDDQAKRAMLFVVNHLDASPSTHIFVVGQSEGVRFLIKPSGANGNDDFTAVIGMLQSRGVIFVACRNSMSKFGVAAADLIAGVRVVPSGVAELARLQASDGCAYIKP